MSALFEPISVLGMMSGTSFDGVDAALLETDGQSVIRFGATGFEAYSDAERGVLREAMGKWPGEDLDAAHSVVLGAHSRLATRFEADLIGFHGQTLAHDPGNARTHQLGDGEALARLTGRDVVWDFRSADMAAGGQGAPLAPFFHHALARSVGLSGPVAFLNLGGVANVTWVDPSFERPEEEGALLACDTGPASALLDDFLSAREDIAFDMDGQIAAKGSVNEPLLDQAIRADYLGQAAPKSLDRDAFAHLLPRLEGMSLEDGAASLTAITAACVGRSLPLLPSPPTRWFVCGGGRHNKTMMAMISEAVGTELDPVEAIGLNGDMLEAQAFAWLSVRVLRGLATSAPGTTGCVSPVCGGHVVNAPDRHERVINRA